MESKQFLDDWWNRKESWNLSEIRRATFPPLTGYLNSNMLLEGTVNLLTGAPKAGKSFIALKLLDCIATGTPFAQMKTVPAQCLYVSEEMAVRELQPRLLAFNLASTNGHLEFRFQQGIKLNLSVGLDQLRRIIDKHRAQIIVLDTFSECHNTAESSNPVMTKLMMDLRNTVARQLGVCILIVHHSGKSGESGDNDTRGAIALEASASDVFVVKRDKERQRGLFFKYVRHGIEPDALNFAIVNRSDGKTDVEFTFE